MTAASRAILRQAIEAYRRLDTDERDIFHLVVDEAEPEPAPKRGRPAGSKSKPAEGVELATREDLAKLQ